jgi:hypothetical protein
VSVLFSDLSFQRFARLKLRELRLEAENNRDDSALGFAAYRVDYVTAKVAVPFLAPRNDPSLLVRFAHCNVSISVGGNERASPILLGFQPLLAAFSPQRGEAFPLADELFDLAQAIAEDTIAHTDYGQVWGFA